MGKHWAEHTVEIEGSIEECFDAITDYETFPRWQSAVKGVAVTDRERRSKLGKDVRFEIDGKVRTIRYTLRYSYDRPERITWDFLEGEGIKDIDGEYRFEDLGGGRTAATYKVGADPGAGIPGPVARRVNKQLVKRSVEELKEEVERRGGAAPRVAGGGLVGSAAGAVTGTAGAAAGMAAGAAGTALGLAGRVAGGVASRVPGLSRLPIPGRAEEEHTEEREREG